MEKFHHGWPPSYLAGCFRRNSFENALPTGNNYPTASDFDKPGQQLIL